MINLDSPAPTPEVVTVEDIEEMVAAVRAARRYHQDVLELVHKELPDGMLFENAAVVGYLIDVSEWYDSKSPIHLQALAQAGIRRRAELETVYTDPNYVEVDLAKELPDFVTFIEPYLRK